MNIYQSVCSCIICKEEHSIKGIHTHYIRKHTTLSTRDTGKGSQKFQLRCSCVECHREMSTQNINAHYQICTKITNCKQCGNRCSNISNKFCSMSCAASFNNTQRDYSTFKPGPQKFCGPKLPKLPKISAKPQVNTIKTSTCHVCSKEFIGSNRACSHECRMQIFRNAGKKSASIRVTRSKDEKKLYKLCSERYNHVTHNEPIFNGWDADILIYDTKTAILWNGPWHYKQLNIKNHSLAQVQNRDAIKRKEIEAAGWTCVIFEDRYYTPESAFKALSSDPWIRTKNDEL